MGQQESFWLVLVDPASSASRGRGTVSLVEISRRYTRCLHNVGDGSTDLLTAFCIPHTQNNQRLPTTHKAFLDSNYCQNTSTSTNDQPLQPHRP